MTNLTPLVTHPAFRQRLARMTAEARCKAPEPTWNDHGDERDNGGTGCAVSLVVLVLAGYAIAGTLILIF